jgi:transcriptional regulator with XRE-family HTH domain
VATSRTFAEVFDQLVRDSGLSAAEIARRLDVYSGQVSHWRRGGGISIANVHKIADLFGVDRAQLEVAAGYPSAPGASDDSPALAALISILRRRWDELQEPEQRAISAVVKTLAGDALHSRKNGLFFAWTRHTAESGRSTHPLAAMGAG